MAAIETSKPPSAGGGTKTLSTTETFKVTKLSKASRMPTGQALKSRAFDFHGRSWRLKVYPTGLDASSRDFVSLFLKCRTEPFRCLDATKITMEMKDRTDLFTVFDDATAPSSLVTADEGFSQGYARFARRRELEAAELCVGNDAFTVSITLVVTARPPINKPAFQVPRIFTNNKLPPLLPPSSRITPPPSLPPAVRAAAITASSSTTAEPEEVVTGSHKLVIDLFSRKKRILGFGECVRSRQFTVGGSNWYMKVYPNGCAGSIDTVSFALARGRSADPATTAEFTFEVETRTRALKSNTTTTNKSGEDKVMHTFDAGNPEQVGYHRAYEDLTDQTWHDTLVVRVGLGVFRNGPPPSPLLAQPPKLAVPPRDRADFLWLLKSEEASDVTFAVGEDPDCAAWRYIEVDAEAVTPEAFEALLHVAYTDHLPDMDRGAAPTEERVQAFVLAADKYEMERLKLRTEEWVCTFVTVYTVTEFLSMAVRYDCQLLRDACVQFATPDHVWKLVKETDGFEELRLSCPQIVTQIESKQRQY
ncbi:hypothetical protein QOZ80_4BG0331560 [Eleusine coracana subsp. coracana]|nr:hypothetical protein QOZ80_4BG0331560 [Eleusine coracana subsp. coracana]